MENEEKKADEREQIKLFDVEDIREKEWHSMPEFISESKGPIRQLIVSFATNEDYIKFGKLIGQNLTQKTQSVWYPKAEIETMMDKVYVQGGENEAD